MSLYCSGRQAGAGAYLTYIATISIIMEVGMNRLQVVSEHG
jgi:hypothetical protein